ncbi:MAG: OadG-related small transporter subunit [Bacteroidota bacterium]
MSAVARSWQILGIGMATVFGVILIFYAMIKAMLKIWRED